MLLSNVRPSFSLQAAWSSDVWWATSGDDSKGQEQLEGYGLHQEVQLGQPHCWKLLPGSMGRLCAQVVCPVEVNWANCLAIFLLACMYVVMHSNPFVDCLLIDFFKVVEWKTIEYVQISVNLRQEPATFCFLTMATFQICKRCCFVYSTRVNPTEKGL